MDATLDVHDQEARSTTCVERFDLAGRLASFGRTPSGGLKIPAFISRTGVQVYQDASGATVREFRPAAEVLAEASYRSFEGAPITRLHPPELITPLTWRDHAIGTVRNVRPDGDRVAADLVVEDAQAIAEIEARAQQIADAAILADCLRRQQAGGMKAGAAPKIASAAELPIAIDRRRALAITPSRRRGA